MARKENRDYDSRYTGKEKKKEQHVSIYRTLWKSKAWRDTKGRPHDLYLAIRFQWNYIGKQGTPSADYPNKKEFQRPDAVYMNKAVARALGLYVKVEGGNFLNRDFYNDLKRLEEVGLIDCLQRGKNTRTKSVYVPSDRWKKYG